jgi:hypothetical protein
VKHVLLTLVVVPLVAGAAIALLDWAFRRRGASFPLLASVLSQWAVAFVGWTLAAGLLQAWTAPGEPGRGTWATYGFPLFAVVVGTWQYRLARTGARERAARLFRWSQLGWLLVLLTAHGAFE